MAGRNETFLRGAHFDDPNTPRSMEHSQHAKNHARPSGIDPRVGTMFKHGQGTPPTHGGMHTKSAAGHLAFAGGDLKSAVESGSVGPGIGDMLPATPKVFPEVATAYGMRGNLDAQIGKRILAEARGTHPNGLPKLRK